MAIPTRAAVLLQGDDDGDDDSKDSPVEEHYQGDVGTHGRQGSLEVDQEQDADQDGHINSDNENMFEDTEEADGVYSQLFSSVWWKNEG